MAAYGQHPTTGGAPLRVRPAGATCLELHLALGHLEGGRAVGCRVGA
ncbi:MAG: hypothetical protein QOJ21_2750, partial [Solirubrobacteraceae bacterium]|nr:hypothetical protein [Solirubrobacteraceae bacterium]